MKTINYTGSSKLISRIVNLLNRRAPLPLDGDGDPDWGSNGQVLSTDGNGNTAWVNQGGGGSGGHTIENTSGADLPQEDNLQFVGVYTRDDSVNNRTEVNIVRQMTKAAMEALSSAEKEGFIDTTDEDDDYIPIAAEDVKRGVSDVDADLTALENGKVNRSGDTMTGILNIHNGNGDTPLFLKRPNYASGVYINFENSNGVLGYIGVNANKKPVFYDTSQHLLSMRTVTTLVNESVSISSGSGSKTYSALTATALSAYDEIHIMAGYGNVYINGMATKAQMAAVTAKTYPANGRLHFYGGNVLLSGSETINYYFRIRADANGLNIINGSVSSTLDYLLIEGITY